MHYIMNAIVVLALGILIGIYIGYRIYSWRLRDSRGQSDKHLFLVRCYDIWMMTKQEGKSIPEYLKKRNIESVVIYGMSFLGNRLYYELRENGVEVKYGIDQNAKYEMLDLAIYQMEDLKGVADKGDAVIVTAIFAYDAVKERLIESGYQSIYSIDEILYQLLIEKQ